MTRMYNHPQFRRAYLQAVQQAVDGPMLSSVCNPVMDAKHRSLVANGITHCDGQTLTDPTVVKTWFAQRRAYLVNQLNEGAAAFAITSNNGNNFSTNTAVAALAGSAPLGVVGLRVNGIDQPVTWPTLTTWNLTVPLSQGANLLVIEGYDSRGNVLFSDQITVTTTNGSEPTRILINEWMAANSSSVADPADGDFEDWFELFNPNSFTVNLSGWSLADNIDLGGARWTIPSGTTIAPFGFLLVWADEELAQNTATNPDLHADFKLSQNGEVIALFDTQGRVVDSVQFGAQANNISQGRSPDGGTNYVFYTSPTPGAPVQTVRPTLNIPSRISTDSLRLTWSSEPNRTYKLQYADTLNDPTWFDLPSVTATDSTTSIDVAITGVEARFYRVLVVTP